MAIKSYGNDDGFDGIDYFGRNGMFGGMERMFDEMRSLYGLEGRGLGEDRMDGRWTDARRTGTWGDAATSLEFEDGRYVFVMDLPGFEREDIDLVFDDGFLSVAAVHEAEDDSSRRSRRVRRSIRIPADVHDAEITAQYRNGVLEVHLPVVEDDHDDGRHIDIQG